MQSSLAMRRFHTATIASYVTPGVCFSLRAFLFVFLLHRSFWQWGFPPPLLHDS